MTTDRRDVRACVERCLEQQRAARRDLQRAALPSVMRKIIAHALRDS